MDKMETLKHFLAQKVQHSKRNLEKFKEGLEKDPVRAFSWVDGTMASTAYGEVAERFLNHIAKFEENNGGAGFGASKEEAAAGVFEHIRAFSTKQILTKARFSEQSTSIGSNKMGREELAAYADLVSEMEAM